MAKTMTRKEAFEKSIEIVKQSNVENREEIVAKLEHEIELLEKKNSSNKPTGVQLENEDIKNIIVEELTKIGKPVTISELMETSEVIANYVTVQGKKLSNQKLSALLTQMSDADKGDCRVVRVEDKKKALFTVA